MSPTGYTEDALVEQSAIALLARRMSVAVGCSGTHSIRNGSCMVEIPPV